VTLADLEFIDLLLRGPGNGQALLRRNGTHVSKIIPTPGEVESDVNDLYKSCERKMEECKKDIFRLEHDSVTYRVTAESRAIIGNTTYTLRRCASSRPTLESMEWPSSLTNKLINPALRGLILITGPMGVGKTHSCGGLIVGRLNRHGGYARTLEDPIELPLDGLYADGDHLGVCVQSEVEQNENGYAIALRKAVRESPDIILVGEVRDQWCAAELLRAGLLGHSVISTVHADNVTGALERLRSFAKSTFGDETSAIMAEAITAIVHIKDDSRKLEFLFLKDEAGCVTSARSIVASGNFAQLRSDINRQAHGIMRGGDDAVFGKQD
jgi:twitching motility protein PilT